jgi:hypothetical protein
VLLITSEYRYGTIHPTEDLDPSDDALDDRLAARAVALVCELDPNERLRGGDRGIAASASAGRTSVDSPVPSSRATGAPVSRISRSTDRSPGRAPRIGADPEGRSPIRDRGDVR